MMSVTSVLSDKDISNIQKIIDNSDAILIGAGGGLSAAVGLSYSDFNTFNQWFPGYYQRYGLKCVSDAVTFDFPTVEEYYAYWTRLISTIRYNYPAGSAYQKLFELVKDKPYFVITTNVDGQFLKAGFDEDRIYSPHGDYSFFQCSQPCTKSLYQNKTMIETMLKDLKTNPFSVKSINIPYCPNCGSLLVPNIIETLNFIEPRKLKTLDYLDFLKQSLKSNILLLELGVGTYNSTTIRLPFEYIAANYKNASLIRINLADTKLTVPFAERRSQLYNVDINEFLSALK